MIYTSYFAKYRGPDGVSIALWPPRGYKGEQYKDLAPSRDILLAYKNNPDEIAYEQEYNGQLSTLDKQKVIQDLDGKVLLCYEGKNKFCHRHLVAKWLGDEVIVEEIE